MYRPMLGVSLAWILNEVSRDSCETVFSSGIATCEITPDIFADDELGNKKSLVKQTLSSHNVRVSSIHARHGGHCNFSTLDNDSFQKAVATVSSSIDLAVELDAPMIVVHLSIDPIVPEERSQRLEQVRKALYQIGARCEQVSKKVAVEFLPRSSLGNTVDELFSVLNGLSDEIFGVCLDVNHFMDRYKDISTEVRRLKKRLISLHISDYDGIDEKHWLPGKGVVDWPAFMAALRDVDYSGPFNYECSLEGDTLPDRIKVLEDNFDWLSKL